MKRFMLLTMLTAILGAQQMTVSAVEQSAIGTPYLSGGIGEEELAQVRQARGKYNVRLLFAEVSGAYITGVRVQIADGKGKTVLDVGSAGPYLFAKLPAGHYRIKATYEGRMKEQPLELQADSPQEDIFRW